MRTTNTQVPQSTSVLSLLCSQTIISCPDLSARLESQLQNTNQVTIKSDGAEGLSEALGRGRKKTPNGKLKERNILFLNQTITV